MADKNVVNESAKGVNDPWRKYTRGMRTAYEQARFEHFVEEQVAPKTAYDLAMEEWVKTPVQQEMAPQPGGSSTHGTQVETDGPEKVPVETHGKEKMAVETDEKEKVTVEADEKEKAAVETHEKEGLAEDLSESIVTGQKIFSRVAFDAGGLKKDEAALKWERMCKERRMEFEKIAATWNEKLQQFAHAISDSKPLKIHEIDKREFLDTNQMTELWEACTPKQVFFEAHKGTKWSEDYLEVLWMTQTPHEVVNIYKAIAHQRREHFKNFQQMSQKRDEQTQKATDAKFKES